MLPLPDGVVIGRVNLAEVVAAAATAQQQALQAAVHQWQQDSAVKDSVQGVGPAVLASRYDGADVVSLNTTANRGISFEVGDRVLLAVIVLVHQQQLEGTCPCVTSTCLSRAWELLWHASCCLGERVHYSCSAVLHVITQAV